MIDQERLQQVADAAAAFEDEHGALVLIGPEAFADPEQWHRALRRQRRARRRLLRRIARRTRTIRAGISW